MATLVVGSTAYDVLLEYPGQFSAAIDSNGPLAFVTPGMNRHYGGTAANIAWNMQVLGGQPLPVSTVGADGDEYLDYLRQHGIELTHMETVPASFTATAIIATDKAEKQIILYHPGADALGTWPELAPDSVSCALIGPREEAMMMAAVRWCKEHGIPYYFDPGQRLFSMNDSDLREGVTGSAGLFANEDEWGMISGRLQIDESSVLGLTGQFVLTKAAAGVTAYTTDGQLDVPAVSVDTVRNPTGAGDALRAGYLVAREQGKTLQQRLQLGVAAAALVVGKDDTMLTTAEAETLL